MYQKNAVFDEKKDFFRTGKPIKIYLFQCHILTFIKNVKKDKKRKNCCTIEKRIVYYVQSESKSQ